MENSIVEVKSLIFVPWLCAAVCGRREQEAVMWQSVILSSVRGWVAGLGGWAAAAGLEMQLQASLQSDHQAAGAGRPQPAPRVQT